MLATRKNNFENSKSKNDRARKNLFDDFVQLVRANDGRELHQPRRYERIQIARSEARLRNEQHASRGEIVPFARKRDGLELVIERVETWSRFFARNLER